MKRTPSLPAKASRRRHWSAPSRLLVAAALLHLLVSTGVLIAGRYALLPDTFDKNGTAVSFASDGRQHREDATTLAQLLQQGEFRVWFNSPYPLHVKLYSISFGVLGPLMGFNVLGAEGFNLLCYLSILFFVYTLGTAAFERRAGLLAAAIVALWPTLLLHTTQFLKDPFFIAGMLALIEVMILLALDTYPWRRSAFYGAIGALLTAMLWKTRPDMAPVVAATVALGCALLIFRQAQLRQLLLPNLGAISLLIALGSVAILLLPAYRDRDHPGYHDNLVTPQASSLSSSGAKPSVRWWQVGARVGIVRQRFVDMYPASNSQIDRDVLLAGNWDLIRYLPRAAAVGFLAPFPRMWCESGNSVGSGGRKLSGVETSLMYLVEALAVVGVWSGRRKLQVWLLLLISTMGAISLGLVIVNVGTLYRLRYAFLILLIILAAGGTTHLVDYVRKQSQLKKVDA